MLKQCAPLWREAHLEVKMYKALQVRSTFGSCDVAKVSEKVYAVEKVHTAAARSTCGSELKCTKHHMFVPLMDVQMPS